MFHSSRKQAGFTLSELMIAMVFVSFMLIFMALALVQMLRTYDKTVSVKQVNQAGRAITEDIAKSMRSQLPTAIKAVNIKDGVLCVDNQMYFWRPLFANTQAPEDATLFNATPNASFAPVNAAGATMVRKTLRNTATACTIAAAAQASNFVANSEVALLSSRSRIIWANVTPVPNEDGRLFKLQFIIGTYDQSEVDTPAERAALGSYATTNFNAFALTPHREQVGSSSAKITCLPGGKGAYCSFAEFSTIVYVAGDSI